MESDEAKRGAPSDETKRGASYALETKVRNLLMSSMAWVKRCYSEKLKKSQ